MGIDLEITDLNKTFHVKDNDVKILENISMSVKQGEFVSIVGHSGCGKSTLLKIIAGLVPYTDGHITLGGEELAHSRIDRHMIFQDHRLLPWLTVSENILFGLYDISEKEKKEQLKEHISLVHLEGFEYAYPHQLSGGMAQRTAIARALIRKPSILLLDEPFGALDALTKIEMQQEIMNIWEREKTTMILVTHDIDEAIFLSDEVIILTKRPGKIKQIFPVEIARERIRSDPDFVKIKAQIYAHFFEQTKKVIEYYI